MQCKKLLVESCEAVSAHSIFPDRHKMTFYKARVRGDDGDSGASTFCLSGD